MDNLKTLENEVFEVFNLNFENNMDKFYLLSCKELISDITKYVHSYYDKQITKDIVIQDFIVLLIDLNELDIPYNVLWTKIKRKTNNYNETIDTLSNATFSRVFKYISSAIITGLANGTIIKDKYHKSKIPKLENGEINNG